MLSAVGADATFFLPLTPSNVRGENAVLLHLPVGEGRGEGAHGLKSVSSPSFFATSSKTSQSPAARPLTPALSRREREQKRAFTMVELLVVIFIVLILLSIFVPYGLHLREMSRRTDCAENLRQIFGALQTYAHDNSSMFPRSKYDSTSAWAGYKAFTGSESPDPFAADSTVKANDVTASYWLLYRIGYLTKSSYFVCNGDDASPDRYANERARSNFASPNNLSYSFATPFSSNPDYKLTSDLPSAFVLAADINPEGEDASRLQKSEMNSNSHRGAGQNVLYAYGAVEFKSSPKVALAGDNIYTLRPRSTTAPATVPSSQPAVDLAPWDTTDSYLVPKLSDRK